MAGPRGHLPQVGQAGLCTWHAYGSRWAQGATKLLDCQLGEVAGWKLGLGGAGSKPQGQGKARSRWGPGDRQQHPPPTVRPLAWQWV